MKRLRYIAAIIFTLTLVSVNPRPAVSALCSTALEAEIATGVETGAITGAITTMTGTLIGLLESEAAIAEADVEFVYYILEEGIKNRMTWFWSNWTLSPEAGANGLLSNIIPGKLMGDSAARGQASSSYTGMQGKNMSKGQSYDGAVMNYVSKKSQLAEYEARKRYKPNETGCQVDTAARYANHSKEVSKALTGGYSTDFNKIGSNNANSKSGGGSRELHAARWQKYKEKFCDPKANRGAGGCGYREEKETTNMHIMPSKTIFGQDTIDMADAHQRDAVEELLFNITGYQTSDSISSGAFGTATAQENTLRRRQYLAQMDAVGALAYSVVAERAPGLQAPEIQALRQKQGVDLASEKPSSYELRQAFVENLWDGDFYGRLYDSAATITQKEVYLKAYGLTLLNEIISKQEKIANAYAIEAANMLEKRQPTSSVTSGASIE